MVATKNSNSELSRLGLKPYKAKKGEEHMSAAQIEHFKGILKLWKGELMQDVDRTVHHMQDEASNFPDPTDRATQESDFSLELRTRDRERKLIKKIDESLILRFVGNESIPPKFHHEIAGICFFH